MNTEVRTIKDFTEALQDAECSKITLMSNIQVLSNINIDRTICIDMNEFTIRVHIADGLAVSDGEVEFMNGSIISQVPIGFVISGKTTSVILRPDVIVQSEGCAIYVKERAKLLIDGSTVTSTRSGNAITIEGHTIAKQNTSVEVINGGKLSSNEASTIDVSKRGSFKLTSGEIECASSDAAVVGTGKGTSISLADGSIIKCAGYVFEVDEFAECIEGDYISEAYSEDDVVSDSEPTLEDQVISNAVEESADVEEAVEVEEPTEVEEAADEPEASVEGSTEPVENTSEVAEIDSDTSTDESKSAQEVVVKEKPQPTTVKSVQPKVDVPKNIVLKKPVYVYGTPSNNIVIGKVTGSVSILMQDVRGSDGSMDFVLISYLMSGMGGRGTGYIRKSDI